MRTHRPDDSRDRDLVNRPAEQLGAPPPPPPPPAPGSKPAKPKTTKPRKAP